MNESHNTMKLFINEVFILVIYAQSKYEINSIFLLIIFIQKRALEYEYLAISDNVVN